MGCFCFGRKKKHNKYGTASVPYGYGASVPYGYGGPQVYRPKPKKRKSRLQRCLDCYSIGSDVAGAGGSGDGGGGCGGGGCGGGGGGGGCGGGGGS